MLAQFKDLLTSASKFCKAFAAKHLSRQVKLMALRLAGVVFVAYVLASAASSFAIPFIMKSLGSIKATPQPGQQIAMSSVALTGRPNYHEVRKAILSRNIFNLDGEFPDETEEEVASDKQEKKDFDADAPCVPSKLPITLVGTIFMGDGSRSLATIQEKGYSEVDIYRSGDFVIGNENVQVMSVQRNRVVLSNNGVKECLEIADALAPRGGELFYGSEPNKSKKKVGSRGLDEASSGPVLLQASWVEAELGDGFGKIIQSARLVPNTVDNRVNGFKIFAIQKQSLFDKIGLKNGDVITQVNETVMEAEQGFALYQAFLDDRDISIRVLRDGKTPTTLQVRIR